MSDPLTERAPQIREELKEAEIAPAEAPPSPMTEPWPELHEDALYGLAGDVVRTIDPHTEADAVAVLANVLVMFGNCAGPSPHVNVGAEEHGARLFVAVVGDTSRGRKGTSLAYPKKMFAYADPDWTRNRIQGGLSTGEGLINEVRDPKEPEEDKEPEPPKDRRLLVIETELARSLRVMRRDHNTLSTVVRQAWDSPDLNVLTRNDPLKATGTHISIIGHVTSIELRRHLESTEVFSGFANRFLWLCVRESKLLPEGGSLSDQDLNPLIRRLEEALAAARRTTQVQRDQEATAMWREMYPNLRASHPGLLGAATSRAEAQALRLSLVYALLDESRTIRQAHLRAAAAFWRYAADSARHIFGQRTGDPIADRILDALKKAYPDGLDRTDLFDLFDRHSSAKELERALALLVEFNLGHPEKAPSTGKAGRRAEIWRWTGGN